MASVTQRIKQIKQPRGGYLNPKLFESTILKDEKDLNPIENIHSSLIGLAVDYLTRFLDGSPKEDAFKISLMGATIARDSEHANKLLAGVTGLDDYSILNACQLVGYDVCYRSGLMGYRPVQSIQPDEATIENIRILVNRSLSFLKEYGPTTADGLTFEGGYSEIITSGDCDFLTRNTLWDFKVSVKGPTSTHTLQLLIYYLMGKRSIHPEFQTIASLGVFNPRLNTVYLLNVQTIPEDVLAEVSTTVIGYQTTSLSLESKESYVLNKKIESNPIHVANPIINKQGQANRLKSATNYDSTVSREGSIKKWLLLVGIALIISSTFLVGFLLESSQSNQEEFVRDIRSEFEVFKQESQEVLTTGNGFFRFYNLQVTFLRDYEVKNIQEAKLLYELSDELLNSLYQEFKQTFSVESFEQLRNEQLEWIKGKQAIEANSIDTFTLFNRLRQYTVERCEEWVLSYYR